MIKINRQIFERLQTTVEFFKNFSDEELFTFLKFMNPERFEDGEIIFEENARGDKMFILINGSVVISKLVEHESGVPTETELATIKPGECFGEMGLIDQRARSAKATAKGHTLLFSISDEMLTRISATRKFSLLSFKLYKNFAIMMVVRLRDSNQKIVEMESSANNRNLI
jgi:CRP-like cAMP-binding protein